MFFIHLAHFLLVSIFFDSTAKNWLIEFVIQMTLNNFKNKPFFFFFYSFYNFPWFLLTEWEEKGNKKETHCVPVRTSLSEVSGK